jgi:hypothetical protein
MANYKGFPLCQANESSRAAQRLDSILASSFSTYRFTAKRASRRVFEQGCGRTNYNRSFVQLHVLRTLMKDARGGLIR